MMAHHCWNLYQFAFAFRKNWEHLNQVQAVFSAPEGIYLDNPITHHFIVHLGGEKLGYKMKLELETSWDKNGDYSHLVEVLIVWSSCDSRTFVRKFYKLEKLKPRKISQWRILMFIKNSKINLIKDWSSPRHMILMKLQLLLWLSLFPAGTLKIRSL